MKNQDIAGKLNNLKAILPDKEWKDSNREILFSQISNSGFEFEQIGFFERIAVVSQRITRTLSQPAWAVFFIFILVGSVFGVYSTLNAKPGDSLYIAKVISKKAQIAVTFDKEEKTKLETKFANDYAREITQVLSEPNINENVKNKLTKDFKDNISAVRSRLQEINKPASTECADSDSDDADTEVFSANLGKEDAGLQISDSELTQLSIINSQEKNIQQNVEQEETAEDATVASSTPNKSADQILQEAESMFDNNDFSGVLNKLEEIDNIINGPDSDDNGEVKGASEGASSTDSSLE